MTAPATSSRPALDEQVSRLAADPGRTWGVPDALLGLLAVVAALLTGGVVLALLPGDAGAAATAVAMVALIGFLLLATRRPARQSGGLRGALGFDLPRPSDLGRVVGWAVLLLVVQFVAVAVLSLLVPALRGVAAENVGFLRDEPLLTVLVIGVLAVLVAPVVEELLFRGLVLRGLMLRMGFWPAAVLSSALFGVLHAQGSAAEAVLLATATGVFGVGLCVLVRRTGRLGPAIGVHALRNAVAVVAVVLS